MMITRRFRPYLAVAGALLLGTYLTVVEVPLADEPSNDEQPESATAATPSAIKYRRDCRTLLPCSR